MNFNKLLLPIFLSLLSLFAGWVNKEERFIIIGLYVIAIAMYLLNDIYNKIEKRDKFLKDMNQEIERIKEKLKIYEHLSKIKTDISLLKRRIK